MKTKITIPIVKRAIGESDMRAYRVYVCPWYVKVDGEECVYNIECYLEDIESYEVVKEGHGLTQNDIGYVQVQFKKDSYSYYLGEPCIGYCSTRLTEEEFLNLTKLQYANS